MVMTRTSYKNRRYKTQRQIGGTTLGRYIKLMHVKKRIQIGK